MWHVNARANTWAASFGGSGISEKSYIVVPKPPTGRPRVAETIDGSTEDDTDTADSDKTHAAHKMVCRLLLPVATVLDADLR